MIPQIVNPGSNFLLLVLGLSHISPPVIDRADKGQARKINREQRVSISNAMGSEFEGRKKKTQKKISFQRSSVAQLHAGALYQQTNNRRRP